MKVARFPGICRAVLVGLMALAVEACRSEPDPHERQTEDHLLEPSHGTIPPAEWRLVGGATSLDALGAAVVSALAAADTALLESFRLTQREHNEMLWIEMPVARQAGPEFPVELAWENISVRNAAGLRRLLATYGGKPLVFRAVACRGRSRYGAFGVLTDCRVTVVDPGGTAHRLQMFPSVVVLNGVHKIIRYEREVE